MRIFLVTLLLVMTCLVPALAHNGSFGEQENPIEIDSLAGIQLVHENEQWPWKGDAFVYVKNKTNKAWTDFHFKIYSWNSDDISNVAFTDASMGGVNPTSSQTPLTWTIDNNAVGAELNLFFYSNPVLPGQSAMFQIYTDNTADEVQFGLMMRPSTDIPEFPAPLLAIIPGLVGAAGKMLKRRK